MLLIRAVLVILPSQRNTWDKQHHCHMFILVP
jgi:hypothetical protein